MFGIRSGFSFDPEIIGKLAQTVIRSNSNSDYSQPECPCGRRTTASLPAIAPINKKKIAAGASHNLSEFVFHRVSSGSVAKSFNAVENLVPIIGCDFGYPLNLLISFALHGFPGSVNSFLEASLGGLTISLV